MLSGVGRFIPTLSSSGVTSVVTMTMRTTAGEHGAGYKPGHTAFLRNDQRDLAARYHAEADGHGVVGFKARDPCADAAADDLRENSHYRESDSEEDQSAVKPCKLGFYADRCKEK